MKCFKNILLLISVLSTVLCSCTLPSDLPMTSEMQTEEITEAQTDVQTEPVQEDIPEGDYTPVLFTEPVPHDPYSRYVTSVRSKTYGDIEYCVCEDSVVVYFPFEVESHLMTPSELVFTGECRMDGDKLILDGTVSLDIICVRDHYDLPVVHINTKNSVKIRSKKKYVEAYMSIDASGTDEYSSCAYIPISIRGRGNSSWRMFDKKAYRIKTDEKISVFGFSPDKDYVLVSNYIDKSLMRNSIATAISKQLEYIEYTPEQINVDVFLNGEYIGVYGFAEKIEFASDKLDYDAEQDVCDTSYLFEVGYNFDGSMVDGLTYFDADKVKHIVIKEPEITESFSVQYNYIRDYVRRAEKAIKDGEYDEYIDVDNVIDYLIVLELTNNTESALYRSCYFYKPAGGKLKFGPVWDFDVSFGNHSGDIKNYDGWCASEATYDKLFNDGVNWFTYLMEDESFLQKFKARWNEKKEILLKTALDELDRQYALLYRSQQENFRVWDIMNEVIGVSPLDPKKYNTFDSQVQYVRDFINARYKWIDNELNR